MEEKKKESLCWQKGLFLLQNLMIQTVLRLYCFLGFQFLCRWFHKAIGSERDRGVCACVCVCVKQICTLLLHDSV